MSMTFTMGGGNKMKKEYNAYGTAFSFVFDSVIAGLLIGLGSCYAVNHVDKYTSAYVQDVNKDGKEDFVIQKQSEKRAYINMGDGTYLSLDKYQDHIKQSTLDSMQNIDNSLNSGRED